MAHFRIGIWIGPLRIRLLCLRLGFFCGTIACLRSLCGRQKTEEELNCNRNDDESDTESKNSSVGCQQDHQDNQQPKHPRRILFEKLIQIRESEPHCSHQDPHAQADRREKRLYSCVTLGEINCCVDKDPDQSNHAHKMSSHHTTFVQLCWCCNPCRTLLLANESNRLELVTVVANNLASRIDMIKET